MKVVILAGGLGTRLSEETDMKPKPMVEIGGKPILWHIMKSYNHYGLNRFILALGYKGERFVLVDRDHRGNHQADLGLGNRVEGLAEFHDVHSLLTEGGTHRRRRGGLPRLYLQLDHARNFLGHAATPFLLASIPAPPEPFFQKSRPKLSVCPVPDPLLQLILYQAAPMDRLDGYCDRH